jgi:hypothetical protein
LIKFLCHCISNLGRAVNQLHFSSINHFSSDMISNLGMLGSWLDHAILCNWNAWHCPRT